MINIYKCNSKATICSSHKYCHTFYAYLAFLQFCSSQKWTIKKEKQKLLMETELTGNRSLTCSVVSHE